jgi:hypothetical protein
MNIYKLIEKMIPFIRARDWEGLESAYNQIACRLAGEMQAVRISAVALADYQKTLSKKLKLAVKKAKALKAKAIYFEYDLDNDWESEFFICPDYYSQRAGDDDWICDWMEDFSGPNLPAFCAIYQKHGFDKDDTATGSTCYLVARTVAIFGRCLEEIKTDGVAVCIAFHDQDPVMRIREIA